MHCRKFQVIWVLCIASLLGSQVKILGAQSQPESEVEDRWAMERVTLNDGRSYRGLIKSVGDDRIEFADIRRMPGQKMFVTILSLDRPAIVRVERLEEAQRQELADRIKQFSSRAQFEVGRMENILLTSQGTGESRRLVYRGEWFEFESTADGQVTRQFIVRLEQMFMAFRQLLPPKRTTAPQQPLRIILFGTLAGYQQHLRAHQITLRNPAYFLAAQRLVVVGSDVRQIADQHAILLRKHSELRQKLSVERSEQDFLLANLETQFKSNKGTDAQWKPIAAAARAKLAKQQNERLSEMNIADRNNDHNLTEEVDQTLARLYHETFHAYLDDYVYPEKTSAVPRWLNEGLAQIFEAGLLEADTLRIDAPAADRLARLQADLRGPQPLRLADLLLADQKAFLVPHSDSVQTSQQHYLYSWGLAWYLTFDQSLLGTKTLDRYVALDSSQLEPIPRFEQLVGQSLSDFESNWRKAMLELKPGRAISAD
jgi:hypothetical protein